MDRSIFLEENPYIDFSSVIIQEKMKSLFFGIDDDVLGRMMVFAKKIAKAIKDAVPCVRVGVSVIGLEVPHAHIHLIPINNESDMFFVNPKLKLTCDEFMDITKSIIANLS